MCQALYMHHFILTATPRRAPLSPLTDKETETWRTRKQVEVSQLTPDGAGFPTQCWLPNTYPSALLPPRLYVHVLCPMPGLWEAVVQGAGLGRTGEHRERNPSLLGLPTFLVSRSRHVTGRVDSQVCQGRSCHSPSTEPMSGSNARPPVEPEGQCLGSSWDIRNSPLSVPSTLQQEAAGWAAF